MSPSLLDTGSPNGGDLSFGDQMNPNLNINAPSASRSSVQARPKLVKIKKQSNSKKFESMGNPGSGNEAGFIPFRPVVENLGTNVSAFGRCGSVSGEFGFGKAGNEPFVFQTSSSNNLGAKPGRNVFGKIDGSTNVFDVDDSRKSIFNDGGKGIGSTPVLPEEMKNLNIKEPENTDGSGKSEGIGAANVSIPSSGENFRTGSGVFGMSTSTAFPERKDGFVFASKVDAKAPPIIEFKIPSLLSGSGKKLDLSAKVNQRKGKSNQAMPVKLSAVQGFVSTKDVFDKDVGAAGVKEESVSAAETESFKSSNKGIDSNIDTSTSSSSSSFVFSSYPRSGMDFTFSTSASQSQPSVSRPHQKKNSAQIAHDSNKIGQNVGIPHAPYSGASLLSSPMQNQKEYVSVSSSKAGDNHASDKGQEIKHELDLTSAASATAQGACERWRSRGNQAYTKGDLSKAEDWYTQGISSVPKSEKSRSCLRALMLCYSNRAATRISLGKVRDALGDCLIAVAIDPHFIKVQIRAASCHLALGEVEDASRYFRKCLQSGSDVCVDRKVAVEASEGLKNAQKVSECMHCSADLLQKKASDDAEKALELIAEALQISSYSEKLLRMKAESLLMLHKYEEVIQLCEQTYASAERNSPPLDGQQADVDDSEILKDSAFRIWRCCMIFKSYFHLGRLEDAVAYLEKQEELQSVAKRNRSDTLESSIQLAATVRELLQHKTLGNEAFQSGKYAEAIEHYSAALSCNAESRPFSAICFCNRAAAYKALGQITDAIADCSLAIALNRNFLKAISRRATLYKMVRDNGQAAKDFQRLVSLITKQIQEKTEQLGGPDKSMKLANDLRQARLQLYEIEEDAIKQCPRNMYLIMGIQPSASASEIKKAYRKAALRHHPDKAVQALGRYDNGDDKLWKQIRDDAYKEADKLFKVIGEAYAVLSDPTKRSQYDLEEGKRNVQKAHTGSTSRASTDAPSYSYDRTDWREAQRSYGVSSTRGPEATRSSRYY